MNLSDFKLLYVCLCVIVGIIILTPTLALFIQFPGGETFSELWLFGSDVQSEAGNFPFNVSVNQVYNVSIGIRNHMSKVEYYKVLVKLKNQTDLWPSDKDRIPSSLNPITEYRLLLRNGDSWEQEVLFSFDDVFFGDNASVISKITVSGDSFNIEKSATWDPQGQGYYYQLFFELWRYNDAVSTFQYDNRFVSIALNVTENT